MCIPMNARSVLSVGALLAAAGCSDATGPCCDRFGRPFRVEGPAVEVHGIAYPPALRAETFTSSGRRVSAECRYLPLDHDPGPGYHPNFRGMRRYEDTGRTTHSTRLDARDAVRTGVDRWRWNTLTRCAYRVDGVWAIGGTYHHTLEARY